MTAKDKVTFASLPMGARFRFTENGPIMRKTGDTAYEDWQGMPREFSTTSGFNLPEYYRVEAVAEEEQP